MKLYNPTRVSSRGASIGKIKSTVKGFKMPRMSKAPSVKMPRMTSGGRTKIKL